MSVPPLIYLGVAAVGAYGYATGRISDFVDKTFNRNKDKSSSQQNMIDQQQQQQQQRPTIIVQPPSNNNVRSSYLLPLGCACFIGLGGYYYYIHHNGTKKVIGAVEETAEETQNLVQQTDDNNSVRFEILDKKNQDRAQDLEIEIRSEQRAGFNVLSEQLYCLQQVAIQTLSAVASLSMTSSNNDNNNNNNNEKLLVYCDKAQEMTDTILSDQHILKTKENNLSDIKAEIQLRNNDEPQIILQHNNNQETPGGPYHDEQGNNNNNNNNIFDVNHNQSTVITNVSSKSYKKQTKQNDDDDDDNTNIVSSMVQTLQNGMKAVEVGHYIWNNKEYVLLSSGAIVALYIGNKTINYYNHNDNGNNNNNIEISGNY